MAKYRKKEIHMIDISSRLEMKIVHEEFTSDDEKEWENEIDEIYKSMEQYMQRYEENLKLLFTSAILESGKNSDKDADYFIHEYGDKFIGRNDDNIKKRLSKYAKYIEQD